MNPASRALQGPVGLGAITLLVVNDHVLKVASPGLVTGKLSDVAGLMFFPLLLAAIAEQLGVRRGLATIITATIATGAAFAAVKLWAPAGDAYRVGLGVLQWPFRAVAACGTGRALPALRSVTLVADPSDLFALCALGVPILVGSRLQVRSEPPVTGSQPLDNTGFPLAAGAPGSCSCRPHVESLGSAPVRCGV